MTHTINQKKSFENFKIIYKIESLSLIFLLGFELSYYLLIVQTGLAQHYNSDLVALSPLFVGGVSGTLLSGMDFSKNIKPIHKIIFALSLQLLLSFSYPNFNTFTLGILGVSVGMMAPLSVFLFKQKQKIELFIALAIAYTTGTYLFTTFADTRGVLAIMFTTVALASALLLKDYKIQEQTEVKSRSFFMYIPLMFWIFLDSNLFESLSRTQNLDIWSHQTFTIITFHLFGLFIAYFNKTKELNHHIVIAIFFMLSYALTYLNMPIALAIVYPFVISYYNVIVFMALSKEMSLKRLSFMMVFIAWIASGAGLALALSKVLY